ncbi:MAG: 50S ribosomal protein L21 [Planctomycetota bacterium]
MYAIIEDSGTQIRVQPGSILDIDPRSGTSSDPGSTITFDRVLLIGDEAGDSAATIGTPYVGGATVTAEVVGERAGEKIDVVKFKRRKGYRRKQGHRQPYLRVRITDVNS